MSNDFAGNFSKSGMRRIKRVTNIIEPDVTDDSNISSYSVSTNGNNGYREEYRQPTMQNESVSRREEARINLSSGMTSNETMQIQTHRVEAAGENVSQIASLVSNLERKLTESATSGMLGVFGINSDIVIKEALNRVRANNYISVWRINYETDFVDIYTVIGAKIYDYLEEIYGRYQVNLDRTRIRYNLSRICLNPNQYAAGDFDYLYALAENQKKGTIIRELLSEIKSACLREDRKKFVISIEIGAGCFRNDVLYKLNSICSSDVVILVNSLRPMEWESAYLDGGFGSDSSLYIQKYFRTIDMYDCN